MQKIVPFLWFDHQAAEAANRYVSLFKNSRVINTTHYSDAGPGPSGSVMTVSFRLADQEFIALNGGPEFTITPAISFFVGCDTEEEIDRLYLNFSDGGEVLMELNRYPFSDKFAWVKDRFGVNWQLNLSGRYTQKITPFLTFVVPQHGKAAEAMNQYVSLFDDSRILSVQRFPPGSGELEGTVMHGEFSLHGQAFMAMDGGLDHKWAFTEGLSLFVSCENQEEVDRLWQRLTAGGEEGPCGWLKDQYGLSWQIVPAILIEMLQDMDARKAQRVNQAMLQMKKIDIAGLRRAYEQD
jgi:predicted 3-demethylubiquinone-9 3-methyltransferase (glyoxalase superfamily)